MSDEKKVEKAALRQPVASKSQPEKIQRDGQISVHLVVEHKGRAKAWDFMAQTPGDAVSFAAALCQEHDFNFKRDAIVWEFEQRG